MIDKIKKIIQNYSIEYNFIVIGKYGQKYLVYNLFFQNGEIFIESKYENDSIKKIINLNKFSEIFIENLYKGLLNRKTIDQIWTD